MTTARVVPEWVGKTPDTPIPPHVKVRIFDRCGGRCHISGRKIFPGDAYDFDHITALSNGGENREFNIAPALRDKHREKTAADVAEKAKVYRKRAKHIGIKAKSRFPGETTSGRRKSMELSSNDGGKAMNRESEHTFPTKTVFSLTGVAVICIGLLSSCYTVDQGERGVITTTGAVTGVAEPGMHFRVPMFQSVHKVSVRQQVIKWACPANAKSPQCDGPGVLEAYSRDQQPADMVASVTFHVLPAKVADIYSTYGSIENFADRVLVRRVAQELKTVFGRFNAVTVIQERARFNSEVAAAIEGSTEGLIAIDGVQVENIDFSDSYEQSVEARMLAEVEVARLRQNAEREKVQAEIAVTQATGRADSLLAVAKAEADAARLRGTAEADVIRLRGAALRDNPMLIDLAKVEKWNGTLPTTMVPDATLPFLSLK